MINLQNLRFSLVAILLAFINLNCKEDEDSNKNDAVLDSDGKVFINISDPRLAEIKTDGKKITFYGQKDSNGIPFALNGYRIQSLADTSKNDFVTLDKSGRYSDLILDTGEEIHFSYTKQDSVILSIKANDSLSVYKLPMVMNKGTEGLRQAHTLKDEGTLKIKVVARNNAGEEKNVEGSFVWVRMMGAKGQDFEQKAADLGDGIYSIPIPIDFVAQDGQIVKKTLEVIKNTLEIACFSCGPECPSLIATLQPFCLFPHPAVKLVCKVLPVLLIACKYNVGDWAEALLKLKDKVDEYNIPQEAAIVIYSKNFEYGIKYGDALAMSQVRFNQKNNPIREYDLKIIHEDKSISGRWNCSYTWQGQSPNTAGLTFNNDHTMSCNPCNIGGVWMQNQDKITFIFTNSTQYQGVKQSEKLIHGTMRDGSNGTPGTWTADR